MIGNRIESQTRNNGKKEGASVLLTSKNVLDLKDLDSPKRGSDLPDSRSAKKIARRPQDDEDAESQSSESQESDGAGGTEEKVAPDGGYNSNEEENSDFEEDLNQYKLIYPSRQNTEENYRPLIDYAQKCYEKFTGSYSQKNKEEMLLEK